MFRFGTSLPTWFPSAATLVLHHQILLLSTMPGCSSYHTLLACLQLEQPYTFCKAYSSKETPDITLPVGTRFPRVSFNIALLWCFLSYCTVLFFFVFFLLVLGELLSLTRLHLDSLQQEALRRTDSSPDSSLTSHLSQLPTATDECETFLLGRPPMWDQCRWLKGGTGTCRAGNFTKIRLQTETTPIVVNLHPVQALMVKLVIIHNSLTNCKQSRLFWKHFNFQVRLRIF